MSNSVDALIDGIVFFSFLWKPFKVCSNKVLKIQINNLVWFAYYFLMNPDIWTIFGSMKSFDDPLFPFLVLMN